MSEFNNYESLDPALGLLVIINTLHKAGYERVSNGLLAQVIKNTELRRWYPDARELPESDPYKEINPWFDGIFRHDIPLLEQQMYLETGCSVDVKGKKYKWIKLTKKGKETANLLLNLPHYANLKREVIHILNLGKKRSKISTPRLYSILKSRGKRLNENEKLVYDALSLKPKFPIGFSINAENGTLSPYIDLGQWLSSIKEMISRKIANKEIMRPSHAESQMGFLKKICKKYSKLAITDVPIIELCGLCTRVDVHQERLLTELTIFIEGEVVKVFAREPLPETLQYHSLKIVGVPKMRGGDIKVEAIKIFDRGKSFPRNGRAL